MNFEFRESGADNTGIYIKACTGPVLDIGDDM